MTFLNSDEHKTKLLGVFSSQKPPLEHFPVQSKEHACIYSASSLISITEMLPPPSMVFLCACKCFRIIHSHSHQRWFQCTQAGAKAPCWTPGVKWVICSKSCFLSSIFILSYSFPWSTWRWDVPELFCLLSAHTLFYSYFLSHFSSLFHDFSGLWFRTSQAQTTKPTLWGRYHLSCFFLQDLLRP